MLLTQSQFQKAAGISSIVAARWLEPLCAAANEFQINTPKRLAAFIAQVGHESGGFNTVMIKPRLNETLEDIRQALSYVDYLFPNFEEAKLLTGKETLDDIADSFLNCGVKTVVIKTGKRGCFIKRVDMRIEVPAVSGITAIDTIGAGDNFASGFISALLEGKTLRECALFANATAAISVLSVGATTGVKNRKLVEQLLDEYEG